eukprot:gene11638-biopygen22905
MSDPWTSSRLQVGLCRCCHHAARLAHLRTQKWRAGVQAELFAHACPLSMRTIRACFLCVLCMSMIHHNCCPTSRSLPQSAPQTSMRHG